jgi:betaine/carnitine transporter, BCCT family
MKSIKMFDLKLALPPIAFIIVIIILFGTYPLQSSGILNSTRSFLGDSYGSFYLIMGFTFLIYQFT